MKKIKLTKDQNAALSAYKFAEQQEDRYLRSVFVNAHGQKICEDKRITAYSLCKKLGLTFEHGL